MNPTLAIDRLRVLVGAEHVLASAEDVARHSRCTIPWDATCAAVVFPGSTEEVAAIVRLANELGFPLWTFGRGKNWGYGTKTALRSGAVIMVLERMDTIHEVDSELAYAVIGPGVSYGQLNSHLRSRGIRLWSDCTDSTPEGSVVGNALERGQGYTQNGDHFGSLCGLEVVLPDGSIVRTGGSAVGSRSFHTYKYGVGPYLDGLFSQSNLGIVVKAGIWLMPEPEAFCVFFCEIRDEAAYPEVIDAIRTRALERTIASNVHMANAFMTSTMVMQYPRERLLPGRTHLTAEQLAQLRSELGLVPWTLTGGIYGSKQHVAASRKLIAREFRRFGRITFVDDAKARWIGRLVGLLRVTAGKPLIGALVRGLTSAFISRSPPQVIELILKFFPIFKGIPGRFVLSCAYAKRRAGRVIDDPDPARDNCGLLWCAPVAPMTGRDTRAVSDIARAAFERHGFDYSLAFVYLNPRSVMMLFEILYDREDVDETRRAQALYDEICDATARAGYPQYRTSIAYMDRILGGSGEWLCMIERIKRALDPNDALAPGRYGIRGARDENPV